MKLLASCGLLFLLSFGLNNCASSSRQSPSLTFPMDFEQPYLTLEQIIDGRAAAVPGTFNRLIQALFGTKQEYYLDQPTDMTLDSQGRLLIVDSGRGGILRFVRESSTWRFDRYFYLSKIKHPISIAAGEGLLFISDIQTRKILVLDEDMELRNEISDPMFNRPGDLCYDAFAQRLFISDPPAGRIYIYSSFGERQGVLGGDAVGPGHLRNPISVSVDPDSGTIFILDGLSRKVKQYQSDLSFVSSFGKYDQVPGSFAFPKDIVQSQDGVLFISDALFGNIQMFDPSGTLLYFFGENGTEPGQFLMPRNLYLDTEQHLYITDPYNGRIQIFQYHVQP